MCATDLAAACILKPRPVDSSERKDNVGFSVRLCVYVRYSLCREMLALSGPRFGLSSAGSWDPARIRAQ